MQYRRPACAMHADRSQAQGATVFFTVITYNRKRILCQKANVSLIKEAFQYIVRQRLFRIRAFVLLPDHIHCMWTLPENGNAFSMRWRLIKSYFSRRCKSEYKKFFDENMGHE
ncbi:MAG: hypothetical protein DPW20_13665 [Candidatus Brocadia sp.]|uniref:REP-associated tyrosine transposase n=1 Tax=Candidatus Brocadia TaxID=380240 RepID=UPI000697368B|nr:MULTISPECIES: transposase [Brocadia]MBC6933333.1 transposase [Candidatus Brocadia sp.]MBL1169693.1 transposase [Candidatus Brocadia sp. AMX1]NOG41637.1 transposase [Planctomycetota bacterium]KAA0244460.1 MAG: transposase [Candidatus Brocadia sp. AMX2]MCQ3918403.1 hypothetical protein [Candidatus Brocadia sp.]